ncbi:hypothetical protein Slin_4805 [Spirosoma linguale DSM 74]|uniref:Uncharacterized protein n=1 Tax=Spirosoma linguale (strain ATCC 33905 / DSM 74 / LMG 10896 / Claus 1) TaxID=504472 RepID=D2QQK2_SPILD|nr:hypothetical protein Slin_4805 [Spirosoma linguale DSM 74]
MQSVFTDASECLLNEEARANARASDIIVVIDL